MELSSCYLLMRFHDGSGACLARFRERRGPYYICTSAARIGEAVRRTWNWSARLTHESPLFPDQVLGIHRRYRRVNKVPPELDWDHLKSGTRWNLEGGGCM